MNLEDYLNKYQISKAEFSRRSGVAVSGLHHYISGRYKPNQTTAEKIEKASDLVVSVKEQRGKDDRIK